MFSIFTECDLEKKGGSVSPCSTSCKGLECAALSNATVDICCIDSDTVLLRHALRKPQSIFHQHMVLTTVHKVGIW